MNDKSGEVIIPPGQVLAPFENGISRRLIRYPEQPRVFRKNTFVIEQLRTDTDVQKAWKAWFEFECEDRRPPSPTDSDRKVDERILQVDEILYSQRECSSKFHDGKTFSNFIKSLDYWSVDPRAMENLKLDEVGCYDF